MRDLFWIAGTAVIVLDEAGTAARELPTRARHRKCAVLARAGAGWPRGAHHGATFFAFIRLVVGLICTICHNLFRPHRDHGSERLRGPRDSDP